MTIQDRTEILKSYGATESQVSELLAYTENVFDFSQVPDAIAFPLEPEPHVAAWEAYLQESHDRGVFETLKSKLPQWQFPIAAGMSETDSYRSATRKGQLTDNCPEAAGLALQEPEGLHLAIHESLAGKIPVLTVDCRADFVAIAQSLLHRNEPVPIPDSMGAVAIAGYNNWDRIRTYRSNWEAKTANPSAFAWKLEFKRLQARKAEYQDRFIVLSTGGYSGISAAEMDMPPEEWTQASHHIRLAHECTHYFTRRLLGAMNNNLMDELMADYRGIVAGNGGRYRADWFLRFVGLEDFPNYRSGGRLENYRGNPELSDGAFQILQEIVKDAAENLEAFHLQHDRELATIEGSAKLLLALSSLHLEELADRDAQYLEQAFAA